MSIIYCLLHIGMRLGQRGILNRRAGRWQPQVLEFGVKKKKFSHRAFRQLSPLFLFYIVILLLWIKFELCIEEGSNRLYMIIGYLTQTIMTDHRL